MNRSLAAKSSARLVAVQLLYQALITKTSLRPEAMAADYKLFFEENKTNRNEAHLPDIAPDAPRLKKLLTGVSEHAPRLEPLVEQVLSADWKKERVSPLLLAILRVAAFELAEGKLAAPILVNEYTSLAARFFSDAETGFIHAALYTLAASLSSPLP